MKKSVLIALFLILLIIPVAFAFSLGGKEVFSLNKIFSDFFNKLTGRAIDLGSCFDTDLTSQYPDGKNYYVKGTVTGNTDSGSAFSKIDACEPDARYLREVYCYMSSSSNYKDERTFCPNGCSDGACVQTTPACTENWVCGAWSSCVSDEQTRTCTDSNNCGTTVNKPAESQSCTISTCNHDGTCDPGETVSNCPSDCAATPACNNNGVCDSGETISNCPNDCATCGSDTACKTGCASGDPDCTCLQQNGRQCITGQTCALTNQLAHSGTGVCCSIACTDSATTPTCSLDNLCKPDCNTGDPDCNCAEENGYSCTTVLICTNKGGISLVHSGTGICCSRDCTIPSQNKAPYIINMTIFPSGSIVYGSNLINLKINGTITINDTNVGDRLNVSFVWYEGDIIIKSGTIGRVSMPNATNILATGNGKALRVPYNLTSADYSIGHNYKLGVYLCDGIACNQTNSSIVSISSTVNSAPFFINITTVPANTTTKESGVPIKAIVTLNDPNLVDRLNISYIWYDLRPGSSPSVIVNISNTTGKHSMPNATNVVPSATWGVVLRVPYNLTDIDIGSNYTLGVYACDGRVCNQTNSSMINITTIASLPVCVAPNDICTSAEACTGTQVLHSGTGVCCSTTCIPIAVPSDNGCTVGTDRIVPVGTRASISTANSYCDLDYSWKLQRIADVACQNDYECSSNSCKGNKCLDVTKIIENVGLLKKIWCKITNPLDNTNYNTCLVS